MMNKLITAAAGLVASVGIIFGAVYIDDEGVGFVGKGDVQDVFGWNNKDLQENADNITFRIGISTENTWECYNSASGNTVERNNTTVLAGVLASVARVRNQVTGFNLNGFDDEEGYTEETEGQPTGNCPGMNSSLVEGSIETTVIGGSGFQVSNGGTEWFELELADLE